MRGLLQEENGCVLQEMWLNALERISQPEYLLYRINQSQHQIAISKAGYYIKLLFITGARDVF